MKKILAFNWKMNPTALEEAISLAKASDYSGVIIMPPFIFLEEVGEILKKANLGAQDLSWENPPAGGGAFTGEVSAIELKNLSVEYVIVGHSERRQKLNETDAMINKKVLAGMEAGLKVILCVGESFLIRRRGKKAVENFIKNQLQKDLKGIENLKFKIENLMIAYEPVWSIGAGVADTPQDAAEMIKYVKEFLISNFQFSNIKVLYGGSVDSKNIENFVKYKDIDGFLVGGASLKPEEINEIIQKCLKKQKV